MDKSKFVEIMKENGNHKDILWINNISETNNFLRHRPGKYFSYIPVRLNCD